MAKIGTETVSILGTWHKIDIRYSSKLGFHALTPEDYPDFLFVAAGKEGRVIAGLDEEHVRESVRRYARLYAQNLPDKRRVLILRHDDARQTHFWENRRECTWHGFKLEWAEAYMAGSFVFTPDMKQISKYVALNDEIVIDYTPERAAFLQAMCEQVDQMSDRVRRFIARPPEEVMKLIDTFPALGSPLSGKGANPDTLLTWTPPIRNRTRNPKV